MKINGEEREASFSGNFDEFRSFKSSRFKDRLLRLFFLNLGISSSDHVPVIALLPGIARLKVFFLFPFLTYATHDTPDK